MAKVSIIVPVYNTAKYLDKCINSLLNQTLEDIEVIIINDGSPDNADKVINSYKDKRIKYIKKANEGIGKTRNLGIEESTGEYLMFIDSDDYIGLDCTEKMYNRAKKDNLDIVISNYFEDRDGVITEIKFPSFPDSSLEECPELLNKVNLGPCNKIYKRELFEDKNNRFEENLKYEDAPFVCKLLCNAKKIGKIDECLSYYVIHEASETTVRDERIFDIIEINKIIVDTLSKYDYLHVPMINVSVMILTDYTIQQRYVGDKEARNRFIDIAFSELDKIDKRWRKCSYLKRFSLVRRIIKTNRLLTKAYCSWYYKKRMGEK